MHALVALAGLIAIVSAQSYTLQRSITGTQFFGDAFDFYTSYDPTSGYVKYVDLGTAQQYGMINTSYVTETGRARWGVDTTQILDPNANLGRPSIRLHSKERYNHGLFILDIVHMPENQCGVWPAFWSFGTSAVWPNGGEIDILESTNNLANNIMTLHTTPGCTIAGTGQTGTLLTNDCSESNSFTGCATSLTQPANVGAGFNAAGGGVYAMQWATTGIQIWMFPRSQIPPSLQNGSQRPLVQEFGMPTARFGGSCDFDAHLFDHTLVFNTDFCGAWAGATWQVDGCPMLDPTNGWQSCNIHVATHPEAFHESYWEINHLEIYQIEDEPAVSTTTLTSSSLPAASTRSLTRLSSIAQGRSSTLTGVPETWTTPSATVVRARALETETPDEPVAHSTTLLRDRQPWEAAGVSPQTAHTEITATALQTPLAKAPANATCNGTLLTHDDEPVLLTTSLHSRDMNGPTAHVNLCTETGFKGKCNNALLTKAVCYGLTPVIKSMLPEQGLGCVIFHGEGCSGLGGLVLYPGTGDLPSRHLSEAFMSMTCDSCAPYNCENPFPTRKVLVTEGKLSFVGHAHGASLDEVNVAARAIDPGQSCGPQGITCGGGGRRRDEATADTWVSIPNRTVSQAEDQPGLVGVGNHAAAAIDRDGACGQSGITYGGVQKVRDETLTDKIEQHDKAATVPKPCTIVWTWSCVFHLKCGCATTGREFEGLNKIAEAGDVRNEERDAQRHHHHHTMHTPPIEPIWPTVAPRNDALLDHWPHGADNTCRCLMQPGHELPPCCKDSAKMLKQADPTKAAEHQETVLAGPTASMSIDSGDGETPTTVPTSSGTGGDALAAATGAAPRQESAGSANAVSYDALMHLAVFAVFVVVAAVV